MCHHPESASLAASPYFVIAHGGGRKVRSSRMCKFHTSQSTRYRAFIKTTITKKVEEYYSLTRENHDQRVGNVAAEAFLEDRGLHNLHRTYFGYNCRPVSTLVQYVLVSP